MARGSPDSRAIPAVAPEIVGRGLPSVPLQRVGDAGTGARRSSQTKIDAAGVIKHSAC